jgi:hypothetical protein
MLSIFYFLKLFIHIQRSLIMQHLNEEELTEISIDFSQLKGDSLNESFLAMFGWAVKNILRRLMGDIYIPVNIKGSPSDIKAFANAVGNERKYIEAYKQYGLSDPRTHANSAKLKAAVDGFTRKTGIPWPFKS